MDPSGYFSSRLKTMDFLYFSKWVSMISRVDFPAVTLFLNTSGNIQVQGYEADGESDGFPTYVYQELEVPGFNHVSSQIPVTTLP
jgi:hypothetical protein